MSQKRAREQDKDCDLEYRVFLKPGSGRKHACTVDGVEFKELSARDRLQLHYFTHDAYDGKSLECSHEKLEMIKAYLSGPERKTRWPDDFAGVYWYAAKHVSAESVAGKPYVTFFLCFASEEHMQRFQLLQLGPRDDGWRDGGMVMRSYMFHKWGEHEKWGVPQELYEEVTTE